MPNNALFWPVSCDAGTTVSEVSCRAFSYFTTAERHGLLDVDALLEGLPAGRAELSDPRNRVSWDLWATLCERALEQMEHAPEKIARASQLISESGPSGFSGYIGPIASLFSSAEDLYRITAMWAGPSLYRSHTFSLDRLATGELRFSVVLKPGFRSCRAWFVMIHSALQVVPRFANQPDAAVTIESIGDRSARFLITPPPSQTLRARARMLWAALRAPRAIVKELEFQQEQLANTLNTLRQTEGGFRAALDALPAFVVLYDDDEKIVYANPSTYSAIGRTAPSLNGQPVRELVAIEDRPRLAAVLAGTSDDRPLHWICDDGRVLYAEVMHLPLFEFAGRRAHGLFAVDVSRRVKSEATTQLLLDTFPDLLIRAAADGRLLDVHAGTTHAPLVAILRTMIGRQGFEVETKVPGVIGDHILRCRKAFDDALAIGREQRLELDADLDGTRRFEVRLVPQDDRSEVLIVVRDITVQWETERRLAISERMASVGTLAAGVAHEINNPLTYVLGGLEDLARRVTELETGGTDVSEFRERLTEISDGAGRVRDIVAALRSYSRIDTKTEIGTVTLAGVVERALAMCGNQLRQSARVVQHINPTPPVLADPTQLIQVIVNLLLNASHALVDVPSSDARIEITVDTDVRGWAVIAIEDNGPGIPRNVQTRVFDPFFTTKPRGQGTGLGLSVSQRIVSEHGGELRLASEPGSGCRFTISLPPASQPATPPPTPLEVDRSPPPRPVTTTATRILIIDDEPLVARTFARMLRGKGYVVTPTSSSREALDLLEREPFDLIVCDLMMPELTGMEVHARVHARDPALAKRFLFATGGAFSEAARVFLEQTTLPTLDKPCNADELYAAVGIALDRTREA